MFGVIPGTPPLGFSSVTPVPATWFNHISTNWEFLFDPTGGGTWQPTADIIFKSSAGGFKLNYTNPAAPIELLGYVTIGLSDESGLPLGVGTLTVDSPATFSTTTVHTGLATFNGSADFNDPVTFDDTVATNAVLTANQPIKPTGTNGFVAVKFQTLGDQGSNFNLAETYEMHSIGDVTSAIDATLTFTGGGLARKKRVYTRSTSLTAALTFKQTALAGTLATFPAGGNKCWVEFLYDGTSWEVCGYGGGTLV